MFFRKCQESVQFFGDSAVPQDELQGDGRPAGMAVFLSTATTQGLSETLIQPQCQGCILEMFKNWFFRLLTSFANDLENMT